MTNMTRRSVLASLVSVTAVLAADAALAQAPIFTNGLQGRNPQETFARMIEESLARDPSGKAPIRGATESFTKPVDVYETLRRLNPNAGPGFDAINPTPEQLRAMVAYIRTLRLRRLTATSRFFNTTVSRRNGVRHIVYDNINTLHAGVEVLEDPKTGDAIFKRDCGNGLGQCVYIDFEIRNPREFEVLWGRIRHRGDHCFAWRRVSRPFQNDTEEAVWNPMVESNTCGDCTFDEAFNVISRNSAAAGKLPVEPGHYQIRLIRNERVLLCLKYHPNDGEQGSSFTQDISWQRGDYQRVGEEWHARVHYNSRELKAAGVNISCDARSLAWYAGDLNDEAVMRGQSRIACQGE